MKHVLRVFYEIFEVENWKMPFFSSKFRRSNFSNIFMHKILKKNIGRNFFIRYDGSLHPGLGKRRAARHLNAEGPYFSTQNLLSGHLSIFKWFWLISVPNDLIYHFYGTFFIMSDLDMTRVFLKTFDSDLESLDLILSLK